MTPEDIIAEMRMERQAFAGVFLMVEGASDVKRFNSVFKRDTCSYVVCWGKAKLLDALCELNNETSQDKYLAMADADFDRILENLLVEDNLIYSDYHDFDLDMVLTSLFEEYINKVGDAKKIENLGGQTIVKGKIISSLLPLTKLKYYNVSKASGVDLSSFDWSSCYDCEIFNASKFLAKVTKKASPSGEFAKEYLDESELYWNDQIDLLQATNGHDFCRAIGINLRSKIGNRKQQQSWMEEIELHFSLGYNHVHFSETNVFNQLYEWQEAKNVDILIT